MIIIDDDDEKKGPNILSHLHRYMVRENKKKKGEKTSQIIYPESESDPGLDSAKVSLTLNPES